MTGAASLPPALPGLDPAWSRLVPTEDGIHHLLDTGPLLAELGVEPVGTLLCVHGNPTWSYLWRHVVAESLARAAAGGDAWRVVAIDQLEMGFSERTGLHRPLARRVADLGRLTDALELRGAVVTLGHDWGGVVSLGWALQHEEQLAGVALLNTAIHHDGSLPAALRLALAPAVTGPATSGTTAFLDTTLALARPSLGTDVRAAYRAPYATAARRAGIDGFVRDIPATAAHLSTPMLETIAEGVRDLRVPSLILWGPADPVFQERYLADLAGRLPDAAVHRFEGAGHLVAEDAPVADSVLTWLGDLAGGDERPEEVDADTAEVEPLWAMLDRFADSDDTALVELAPRGADGPRIVSWRLLARRVTEIAKGFTAIGVRRGDRVSLLVPPGADLTAILYACLRIGAVVVVADAGLGVAGLTRAVRGARPDFVVGVPRAMAAAAALRWPGERILVGGAPRRVRRALGIAMTLREIVSLGAAEDSAPGAPGADEVAAILFTSGSTGPAKGVVYTHRRLAGVRDTLRAEYGVGPGTGLVAGFAPFALLGPAIGTRTAAPDMDVTRPATLTADAVGAAVRAVDAEVVFLSPAALANTVATAASLRGIDRRALAGVRTLLSAGAPVGLPLLDRASAVFPGAALHTPYGMTEALLVTDITADGIRAAGPGEGVPVGRPTRAAQVRIDPLGADGVPVGAPTDAHGVTGEVVVRAPHVLERYDRLWRTDRAARRVALPGRWHRTGDVGHLDPDGGLRVEGRLPHVVTTADGVVTPVGVEQRAEQVGGVDRAAAVGVGPRGAQQLVVVLETAGERSRPGLADRPLADAVRAAVGRPVAAVLAVPLLPTDVRHNSKIDRARLAAWATGVLAGDRVTAP